MKNILIAGGSGFVGSHLTAELVSSGYHVYILTRKKNRASSSSQISYVTWMNEEKDQIELPSITAIINLAGESINGRWTAEKKKAILKSRLRTTDTLLKLADSLPSKPEVWINASAIGYYGTSKTRSFTEADKQPGNDFLAEVALAWEEKAKEAEKLGMRTVLTRFGVILGNDGGAFPRMKKPYRFFVGGRLGSGNQWVSWIHIQDAVRLIRFAAENPSIAGPVNITAPHPVTMDEFGELLARYMHRPNWLPVPSSVLKIALGEMSLLLIEGQHVRPSEAIKHQFPFSFPRLTEAFENLLK